MRQRIRTNIAHLDYDRYFHADIAKALALVRSGAVVALFGRVAMPGL